ncbi:nucleolar and spindle-associated protein 1 [Alosa sapidissima]|uniref:nucleolar and spindle-associated protein 1 n=1 Tax=Alosa sapidissima TaxID=34773 RepID=UPI001C09F8BC|nr:nucleolar and spindle-associated protein 1 [Alosa sapidissima]
MDLDNFKYAELRRLAKEVGLKANLKADKLLKALKQHYEQQQRNLSENENEVNEKISDEENNDSTQNVPEQEPADFVTKRRGRGQKTKRKHDDIAESDPKLSPSPVKSDGALDNLEEERRSSKRRKTSLTENTEAVAPVMEEKENKPEGPPEPASDKIDTEKSVQGEEKPLNRPAGKIPRAVGLMKKTKPVLRPTTPNFKKMHEAHFNKMESIDSYVQRKNKQIESFRNSVKELKTLSEKTNLKPIETKTNPKPADGIILAKPKVNRGSLFSPAAQERKPAQDRRRVTQLSASKSALKGNTVFNPSVISTTKINVRFFQATKDNEHKRSLIKTPARMSPHVTLTSTPAKKNTTAGKAGANTSVNSIIKTPGTTPFVFSGETSISNTPRTNKKSAFDLKASLSRPLTYKPHTGKLKPFGETQDNTLNKSQTVPSHQKNYKQHQVQTREDRRVKHTESRKQKKEKILGARRGLAMS